MNETECELAVIKVLQNIAMEMERNNTIRERELQHRMETDAADHERAQVKAERDRVFFERQAEMFPVELALMSVRLELEDLNLQSMKRFATMAQQSKAMIDATPAP